MIYYRTRLLKLFAVLLIILAISCGKKNNPPDAPSMPMGPSVGSVDSSYDFSSSAIDPDDDNIFIRFSWGDGTFSDWSYEVPSGSSVSMSHIYSNGGTFFVEAQAKDEDDTCSVWSSSRTIVITGLSEVPTLILPANGDTINNNTPSFDWTDVPGAMKYWIQVDDDPNFTSPEVNDSTLTNSSYTAQLSSLLSTSLRTKETTKTISRNRNNAIQPTKQFQKNAKTIKIQPKKRSSLSIPDGTYYWRVKAQNSLGSWGSWSDVWIFTIITQGPSAPTLYQPHDGDTINDNTPFFDWSDPVGAVKYWIQVDNNYDFSSPELEDSTLSISEHTASSSLGDGTYYWRAKARNSAGLWGGWSAAWHFTINTMGIPTLYEPTNGDTIIDNTPYFNWSTPAGAVKYWLQVDNDSNFTSPEINDSTITTSYFTATDTLNDETYYWRVKVRNLAGLWGGWSTAWSFTVITQGPLAPTLYEPVNGDTINDNTPFFDWSDPVGAVKYWIQVDNNSNFSSPEIDDSTRTSSYFNSSPPLDDDTYYWRVKARNSLGLWGDWSSVWYFVIKLGSWTTKASMPTARWNCAGAVVDNKIYVIGGNKGSTTSLENEVYDPVTNTWTTKAPLPTGVSFMRAGVVNGRIYVFSGSVHYMYDPITDSWSPRAPMSSQRTEFGVGVVNNKIYAFGSCPISDLNEEYDPATNTWTTKAPMLQPRGCLTAGVVNNKIYAIGGQVADSVTGANEVYDPVIDTWTVKAPMRRKRNEPSAGVINNRIYVIGGQWNALGVKYNEEYNPVTDTWVDKTQMPTRRYGHVVCGANGKIYAIGGFTGFVGGELDVNEEYTP